MSSESVVLVPDGRIEADMKHFDTAAVMVEAAVSVGQIDEADRAEVLAAVFQMLCLFYGGRLV